MIAALNATNRGLGSAKFLGSFRHGEFLLGAPFEQIHASNIRKPYHTSSVFYTAGVLAAPKPGAQDNSMAKKTKKRRPTFIKEWRKHRALTQEQLGERLDLTQATVARIERGDIAYTQPVLEAMADALNCSPADLIMRDPSHAGSIWSIWDQIPAVQRDQAVKVLETFIKKTGTNS